MESETSSNVPHSRQSLEAFGELLEDKALSAWGRAGEGGRLDASARYTWERRLYDGRILGEGGDAWQVKGDGVREQGWGRERELPWVAAPLGKEAFVRMCVLGFWFVWLISTKIWGSTPETCLILIYCS